MRADIAVGQVEQGRRNAVAYSCLVGWVQARSAWAFAMCGAAVLQMGLSASAGYLRRTTDWLADSVILPLARRLPVTGWVTSGEAF